MPINRKSLTKKARKEIYEILVEYIKNKSSRNIENMDQLLNRVLDRLVSIGEDIAASNAIVKKSYLHAVIDRVSTQIISSSNFIPLFLKTFQLIEQEIADGKFGRAKTYPYIYPIFYS